MTPTAVLFVYIHAESRTQFFYSMLFTSETRVGCRGEVWRIRFWDSL